MEGVQLLALFPTPAEKGASTPGEFLSHTLDAARPRKIIKSTSWVAAAAHAVPPVQHAEPQFSRTAYPTSTELEADTDRYALRLCGGRLEPQAHGQQRPGMAHALQRAEISSFKAAGWIAFVHPTPRTWMRYKRPRS